MAKSFFEKLVGGKDQNDVVEDQYEEVDQNEEENIGEEPVADTSAATRVRTRQTSPMVPSEDLLTQEEGQLTLDVYQTPTEVVVKSAVAGVKPEDVDIAINNDMVTIRGHREKNNEVEAQDYYYQELYWGSFSRSVILPVEVDADGAVATYKNGILTVRLPKLDRTKNKKVRVKME